MEIVRCKRCNRVLTNKESIDRGYGLRCYTLMLAERIRKNELDIAFIKHQLKHKTIVNNSKDSMLDWDIPQEVKEVRNEYKIVFNIIVKELKVIFTEDFDYHNVLKPIDVRETPEEPPLTEFCKIELLN